MATLIDVQQGWKVFAQADEIGEVVGVGSTTFDVRTGTLMQHTYRIPEAEIVEAADGLVDLRIDRQTVETMEVDENEERAVERQSNAAPDSTSGVVMDDLPAEYRHLEFGENVDVPPDPRDGTSIVA